MNADCMTQINKFTSIDKKLGIAKDDYKIGIVKKYNSTIDNSDGPEEYEQLFPDIINMEGVNTQKQKSFSITIQKWVGYVKEIKQNSFIAILNDKDKPSTLETAVFDIKNDISMDDIPLLKEGAIFYWSIGYSNYNGQRKKESFIKFKRVINFTEDDVNRVVDRARKLNDSILWE